MRTRFTVLAALVCGLAALVAPVLASAAPRHRRGLTIAAAPNPIIAGQGVLIYGQLNRPDNAGQTIDLYHRINPSARFTLISRTTTNSNGGYEFTRAEGIVMSNRNWFVRGPAGTHSNTIHERVAALVNLNPSTSNTITGHPVVFTGHVVPNHRFERVLLQQQVSNEGNGWRTIASTFTNRFSHFALAHTWARPGTHTLRAFFAGDARNIAAGSDSVTVEVQQKEKPSFTLFSSAPVIGEGHTVTLSGTLDKAGTSTPEPDTSVTLYAHGPVGSFHSMGSTMTASNGGYQFNESPTVNTVYRVATTVVPKRTSSPLNEGVQDVVSITASSMTSTVGGTVTIGGNVEPDKSGHAIFLQRLGDDGFWHDVAQSTVSPSSTYSFNYTFGQAGITKLRTRIFGGPLNVGSASPAVTVTVSGVAPLP